MKRLGNVRKVLQDRKGVEDILSEKYPCDPKDTSFFSRPGVHGEGPVVLYHLWLPRRHPDLRLLPLLPPHPHSGPRGEGVSLTDEWRWCLES